MRSAWTSFLAFHRWADYNCPHVPRIDAVRRRRRRRRPGGPRRRDPPEAALRRALGVRARERLGDRRAHPLRRGDGSARALRADSRLEGEGRAAEHAGERGPLPVPDREMRPCRRRAGCCPACFKNHGNYVVSLGNVTPLAGQAGGGSSASRSSPASPRPKCSTKATAVKGVATGDMGINRKGEKTDAYQPGMELHGKYTFFAEGCRGHLGRQLEERFSLRKDRPAGVRHRPEGAVGGEAGAGTSRAWSCIPPAGRSTPTPTAAPSSITMENSQVAVGFVVGLGYANPYLSPFEEFQRFKTHPAIRKTSSKAASASATARARSPPAGCSRCRSSCSPAAR